jgi:hypothetical protein
MFLLIRLERTLEGAACRCSETLRPRAKDVKGQFPSLSIPILCEPRQRRKVAGADANFLHMALAPEISPVTGNLATGTCAAVSRPRLLNVESRWNGR